MDDFAELRNAFSKRIPYCSGTCVVPPLYFNLFYHGKNGAARIDLSKATEDELESLSRACQPAPFGLGNKDVLDDTYRKAGKLDLVDFSSHFDAARTGLIQHVRDDLLVGHQKLELELYKLNVYEKEGFFKPHKDTPRGRNMFGSLVIVFPTEHEGGDLILRQDGKEWVVSLTEAFKNAAEPSVGYVAFFSDTEHEVTSVRSGYRVTLTYNLYFASQKADDSIPKSLPNAFPQEQLFEDLLSKLTNRSTVLPTGGYLGFGLQHEYPVGAGEPLSNMKEYLKGPDAVLARACDNLGVDWSVKAYYSNEFNRKYRSRDEPESEDESEYEGAGEHGHGHGTYGPDAIHLIMDAVPMDVCHGCECIIERLQCQGAETINIVDGIPCSNKLGKGSDLLAVTPLTVAPKIFTQYVYCGNESALSHIYGHLCLVIRLRAVDDERVLL